MNCLRHQFFARSTLSLDDHRDQRMGNRFQPPKLFRELRNHRRKPWGGWAELVCVQGSSSLFGHGGCFAEDKKGVAQLEQIAIVEDRALASLPVDQSSVF